MGWTKVFGVGGESCSLLRKFVPFVQDIARYRDSVVRDIALEENDLICLRGITGLDDLYHYLEFNGICWFIVDNNPALQQVLKEALVKFSNKQNYNLVLYPFDFNMTSYENLLRNYPVNNIIQVLPTGKKCKLDFSFYAAKDLLFAFFCPSLISIDIADIKNIFSYSPIVYATSVEFEMESLEKSVISLLKTFINCPKSILITVTVSPTDSLSEAYGAINFFKEQFKQSFGNFDWDSCFYWTLFVERELPENSERWSVFWTESTRDFLS